MLHDQIIQYYFVINKLTLKKKIMLISAYATFILALIFVLQGRSSESLRRFSLSLSCFTLLYIAQSAYLDFKERSLRKKVIKLEEQDISDLYDTLLNIKSLHHSILTSMDKYNLQKFEELEDSRYHSMWKSYFLAWFLLENDKIYSFRQNKLDTSAMIQHSNELYLLHKQLLQEFEGESEFEQILNDHFLSLKKDYHNLLSLK